MSPKVSSRCPSYEGGSEGTGNTSSPPLRCAWTRPGRESTAATANAKTRASCFITHLLLEFVLKPLGPGTGGPLICPLVKGVNYCLSSEMTSAPVSGVDFPQARDFRTAARLRYWTAGMEHAPPRRC